MQSGAGTRRRCRRTRRLDPATRPAYQRCFAGRGWNRLPAGGAAAAVVEAADCRPAGWFTRPRRSTRSGGELLRRTRAPASARSSGSRPPVVGADAKGGAPSSRDGRRRSGGRLGAVGGGRSGRGGRGGPDSPSRRAVRRSPARAAPGAVHAAQDSTTVRVAATASTVSPVRREGCRGRGWAGAVSRTRTCAAGRGSEVMPRVVVASSYQPGVYRRRRFLQGGERVTGRAGRPHVREVAGAGGAADGRATRQGETARRSRQRGGGGPTRTRQPDNPGGVREERPAARPPEHKAEPRAPRRRTGTARYGMMMTCRDSAKPATKAGPPGRPAWLVPGRVRGRLAMARLAGPAALLLAAGSKQPPRHPPDPVRAGSGAPALPRRRHGPRRDRPPHSGYRPRDRRLALLALWWSTRTHPSGRRQPGRPGARRSSWTATGAVRPLQSHLGQTDGGYSTRITVTPDRLYWMHTVSDADGHATASCGPPTRSGGAYPDQLTRRRPPRLRLGGGVMDVAVVTAGSTDGGPDTGRPDQTELRSSRRRRADDGAGTGRPWR